MHRELHCLLRRCKFEYNPIYVSQFKNSAKFGEIIKGLRVKYIFVSFLLPLRLLSSSSTAASGPPFTVGVTIGPQVDALLAWNPDPCALLYLAPFISLFFSTGPNRIFTY